MTERTIHFTLNSRAVTATVATHETLVEMLARRFDLYGARESCGQGLCGCCTALVDGRAVSGCLFLAVFADGAKVSTIEDLGSPHPPHPLRLLYAGICVDGKAVVGRARGAERGRDRALSFWQSVPLRRLSGDHRGGEGRRAQAEGRVAPVTTQPGEMLWPSMSPFRRRGIARSAAI